MTMGKMGCGVRRGGKRAYVIRYEDTGEEEVIVVGARVKNSLERRALLLRVYALGRIVCAARCRR